MSDINNIVIRKLNKSEWEVFKNLRIKAVTTDPTHFSSTLEENSSIPFYRWSDMIDQYNSENGSVMLFSEYNKTIVGMAGSVWDYNPKTKHTGSIVWVYVLPEYRGLGIAQKLIANNLQLLKSKGVIKAKLLVTKHNNKAIELYKKIGFTIVGEMEKELFVENKYYNEYLMEIFL